MTDKTDEIRERWAKATPGPWYIQGYEWKQWGFENREGEQSLVFAGVDPDEPTTLSLCGKDPDDNARAIAAAPEDVQYLLAEVDRLRALVMETLADGLKIGAEIAKIGPGCPMCGENELGPGQEICGACEAYND